MLDISSGDRVMLVSDDPDAALRRLAHIGVTPRVGEDLERGFDLVVVERPATLDALPKAWAHVRPGGRLVVVTDNGRSPLRWLDGRSGKPIGPAIGSLTQMRSALAGLGAPHTQVFGLLRGSSSSPTVFRTDLPAVSRAVLGAARANSNWLRRSAVDGLSALCSRGWADNVLPAWMIVASDSPLITEAWTPTGRIGVELNERGVVVLGPGPDGVEKFYSDPAARAATISSLRDLDHAGFSAAPRVLAEPSLTSLRLEWIPGRDVDANNAPIDRLEGWLRQAGGLLGDLQRRTTAGDGTVLVHGDLWLGAMVADGDEIVAIIDWDDSHRGDPAADMKTLLAVVRQRSDIADPDRRRLIAATYDGHREAGGPEHARQSAEVLQAMSGPLNVDRAVWATHRGVRPFSFSHSLSDDERLTQEAVAELAGRLPAANIEMNDSDLPTLFPNDDVPVLDRPPRELVERAIELRRWVALSYLETDASMRQLIDECLDPIADLLGDFEGGMTGREGYVFVAPPGSTTPAHLDFEHNFLLQIRGTKRVTVGFLDSDTEQRTLESMTGGGYGRLAAFPNESQEFMLEPGDGVYISPRLAHTIDTTGDDLSLSFSLVFHTPWLERGWRVMAANHDLRRIGLDPRPYGSSPVIDRSKSAAVLVWRHVSSLFRT